MARITLSIKYKKNTGLLLSPTEVWSLYLYGVDIASNDGSGFSNEAMRMYIEAAQREIENRLNLRFTRQLIDETTSYNRDDYWQQFPILKTKFPVREPLSLVGMLNNIEQIIFPGVWLRSARSNTGANKRRISVVPTGSSTTQANAEVILTGITTQIGFQSFQNIPDYWSIQYVTGFDLDKLPMDLLNVVGKLACFGPLNIGGDLILGAGIASQSISVDGLSQSIATTSSAENSGYSSRLKQYEREIKETLKYVDKIYGEIIFTVL